MKKTIDTTGIVFMKQADLIVPIKRNDVKKISIGTTDIFFDNTGPGKGKITISDHDWGYNCSYFWGAMGENTTLEEFIKKINTDYFTGKLLSREEAWEFDKKKTFAALRKYIKEVLPWYKYQDFQKDLRERIASFQQECADDRDFVNSFPYFARNLEYYLIDDKYESQAVENFIIGIEEPWNFIEERPSHKQIWLEKLHKKLKKVL